MFNLEGGGELKIINIQWSLILCLYGMRKWLSTYQVLLAASVDI